MKTEKGKIIAVWGSPASGKSTFSVKLATAIYDNFESTVIVLFTDLETPMIPVIFPNDKPEDNGSVGVPLSKTDIEKEEIIKNLVTVRTNLPIRVSVAPKPRNCSRVFRSLRIM